MDGDVSSHDRVLWVLHKEKVMDLILFIASSENEAMYCLHVLEIISLVLREQVSEKNPRDLLESQ